MVKTRIAELNKDDIISQSKPYKKLNFYAEQKFELRPYVTNLNISEARMKFKINACMTPTIQMNFPSDVEFASNLWTCSGCAGSDMGDEVVGCRDTQQHVMICPGYAQLREDKNLDNDRDLVHYFAQVIKNRQESDNV